MGVTESDILDSLRAIYDPEIPMINIVDLGLIYEVFVKDEEAIITMSLTSQWCPVAEEIGQECVDAMESIEGISKAYADIVWEPIWTPDMISEEGKAALGWE